MDKPPTLQTSDLPAKKPQPLSNANAKKQSECIQWRKLKKQKRSPGTKTRGTSPWNHPRSTIAPTRSTLIPSTLSLKEGLQGCKIA
jgi:hypothetical protein